MKVSDICFFVILLCAIGGLCLQMYLTGYRHGKADSFLEKST